MPSCNLTALTRSVAGNVCGKYTPAGVSDRMYIFDVDQVPLDKRAPGDDGFYPADTFANVELFAIDIKTDSGKVTSSKSEDDESRSLVATAVINYAFDKFMPIDTAIAFMNVGVVVPITNEKAYVIMSPYRKTKYTCEFDSGDTYDSDHGFTITFTCSPVLYACPMVVLGTSGLNLNSATTVYDSSYYQGITVPEVTSLSVTNSISVAAGSTKEKGSTGYTVSVSPTTADLSFSIRDTDIATVSSKGTIKGIKAGETVLVVSAGTKRDYAIITVT